MNLAKKQAEMQLAVIDRTVLIITRYCWVPYARAPLKLGQYMKRKRVPTIAIV